MVMPTIPVIKIDHATKRYGTFDAIDDVSFSVNKGEIIGFVGLNGAGKSTTIDLLLGFLRSTSGTLHLFGHNILPENAHEVHQRLGFASGDMSLFAHLTGRQYLAFLTKSYKLKSDKRTDELCKLFSPDLDKKLGDLSRGNKQKIALIAAFMHSPELAILDEPSSGLDPLMQQAFLDLIREENAKGTTILMSSHYLNEVADVCSRVLLIRKGKLVKDIPAHQLQSVNGKAVRIVSHKEIKPPAGAESVTHEEIPEGHQVSFVYKGTSPKLQQWLVSQPPLVDFSVIEHDLESAFSDLYSTDESEVTHV
jgi:beta-exotoxin I transport system ATP-binding protein